MNLIRRCKEVTFPPLHPHRRAPLSPFLPILSSFQRRKKEEEVTKKETPKLELDDDMVEKGLRRKLLLEKKLQRGGLITHEIAGISPSYCHRALSFAAL